MAAHRICTVENCGKPHYGHGYCAMHLHRVKTHGAPDRRARPANGELERWIESVALRFESDECLTWPFATIKGYGRVRIGGKDELATRIICERVHGPAPSPTHEAAHSCGRGHLGCVNKRHLSWKTPVENAADKIAHGTAIRGEDSVLAKLTNAQVLELRSLLGKVPQREIAAMFGVDQSTVSDIKRGKSWGWL